MKVYRYLCEDELNIMNNMKIGKLGHKFDKHRYSNTFRYNENKSYIHFFKKKESMKQMQSLYMRDGKDYYFCEFDIPFHILIRGVGTGMYEASGYDVPFDCEREFIVNAEIFNKKWLTNVEFDKLKHTVNVNLEKNKDNPDFELE